MTQSRENREAELRNLGMSEDEIAVYDWSVEEAEDPQVSHDEVAAPAHVFLFLSNNAEA